MALIKLKTNSFKNVVKNHQLLEIIERVISSYPLSFVNIERLRKEVDNLDELFWIKDEEGKYILVNTKFALNFHLTPSQIEGQPADKFIPAYLVDFNKALDDYIKESKSVFIVEGFPLSGVPVAEDYQVIEIPVPGPQGNLNAFIGITQKIKKEEPSESLSASLQLFGNILTHFILIDKENNIKNVSEEFCRIFFLKEEELKGKNYKAEKLGIPVLLKTMINDFIESGMQIHTSKINIPGVTDTDFKLHFIKGGEEEKLVLIETLCSGVSVSGYDSNLLPYDFLVQNIPEPVFIYDKEDLRFLQVNDTALKLYGYGRDEFLRLDLTDLYTPDDIQTLLDTSDQKFKEKVYSKPHRQKTKNGANIFVEVNRTQIKYNERAAYLNTIRNITEVLKLEKERQHFNASFNSSTDLIFLTDKEGFIKSANISATEILGYSNKSFIETSFTALLIDKDRGVINSSVFQSAVKEKLTYNTSFKKAGNEVVPVKLIASPVFNFKGDIDSYNITCSIVHGEVREVIKEVIKEIPVKVPNEDVSSSIPEINFLSGIFHDLLTPINVILGFVQEIAETISQPAPEQQEALDIIKQNKNKLLGLINQILEFVQMEKGQVELKAERINLIDIIEELKYKIDSSNNGELIFGKISSSLEVVTDKEKLLELFLLLINLIFNITGQKKIYISAAHVDNEHFAICLKDNFNKSSQSFLTMIFEIFTIKSKNIKVPRTSSLSIKLAKNILYLLQGEFKTLDDRDNTDAMFVFPLELKKENNEEEFGSRHEIINEVSNRDNYNKTNTELVLPEVNDKKEVELEKEPDESVNQSTVDLSQLSCLYIEDQLDSQMLFSIQMKDVKEIDFAVGLEQAIPLLKNKNFDFLVVDIKLQGDYNGLDILKIVRTMPDYENIPVIAVTAYLLSSDREVYIQAGFSDFISKPLLKENIIASLERILIPSS